MKLDLKFSSLNHPHIDGQTEGLSHSLGNLSRCLVRDKQKGWDMFLPQEDLHIIILSRGVLVNHYSRLYMGVVPEMLPN